MNNFSDPTLFLIGFSNGNQSWFSGTISIFRKKFSKNLPRNLPEPFRKASTQSSGTLPDTPSSVYKMIKFNGIPPKIHPILKIPTSIFSLFPGTSPCFIPRQTKNITSVKMTAPSLKPRKNNHLIQFCFAFVWNGESQEWSGQTGNSNRDRFSFNFPFLLLNFECPSYFRFIPVPSFRLLFEFWNLSREPSNMASSKVWIPTFSTFIEKVWFFWVGRHVWFRSWKDKLVEPRKI